MAIMTNPTAEFAPGALDSSSPRPALRQTEIPPSLVDLMVIALLAVAQRILRWI